MNSYVAEYLGHLSVERGSSRHTIAAYGRDLSDYVGVPLRREVCDDLTAVTRDDVTAFVSDAVGPRACAQHGRAPRRGGQGPPQVPRPRGDHRQPPHRPPAAPQGARTPARGRLDRGHRPAARAAVPRLAGRAARPRDARDAVRLRAAGERADRTRPLGPRSVGRLRRVFGKGGKERIVPIAGMAVHALDAYLRHGRPYLRPKSSVRGVDTSAVFVNVRGGAHLSAGRVRHREDVRGASRSDAASAHAAALVRHAPAGGRRGPARPAGDARARGHHHDAGLHARRSAPHSGGVPLDPSSCASSLSSGALSPRWEVFRPIRHGMGRMVETVQSQS